MLSERLSARSIGRRKSLKEQPIPDVRIHDSSRRVTTFVPATEKVGQVPHRLAPESEYRFENLTLGELLHRIQVCSCVCACVRVRVPVGRGVFCRLGGVDRGVCARACVCVLGQPLTRRAPAELPRCVHPDPMTG